MNAMQRKRMISALGLVDWQPRPHGALVPAMPARAPEAEVADELVPMDEPDRGVATTTEPVPAAGPELNRQPPTAEAPARPGPPVSAAPSNAEGSFGPVTSMDWVTLEAWLATRDHRGATRPVFGVGARDADVLIVGEAPGANEDAHGAPFVGRAGKLLDRMLFAIDCARETNVYITNICKFRPPDNRDPNADEVAADWPILERQIELMAPKLVVAVGRVAAQTLLDSKQSLGELRGQLHRYPRRDLDVLVTYHPAFLLRSPGQKAKAWADLKQIARRIAAA
jgi:DNA polymerase